MADRQIIESTIAINQSCLSKEEREKVYNLLVKYKGAFGLKDEIGTCPILKVDSQVINKSPFFKRKT